jgi:hypothetical protein
VSQERQIEVWFSLGSDSIEPTTDEMALINSALLDLLSLMQQFDDSDED